MPVTSAPLGPTKKRRKRDSPKMPPTKVFWVSVFDAPDTVMVLVTVKTPPSPTVPGTAATNMQLVSSVKAPSSVWIQQMPVDLLNHRPSGEEKELAAVRPEILTSTLGESSSAPNKKMSQVKVVASAMLLVSLKRMMCPFGLPSRPRPSLSLNARGLAASVVPGVLFAALLLVNAK